MTRYPNVTALTPAERDARVAASGDGAHFVRIRHAEGVYMIFIMARSS